MRGLQWRDVEGSRSAGEGTHFNEYVALISAYRIDTYQGTLRLDFVNNRLMSTWFYPDDYRGFVDYLRVHGVVFTNSENEERYEVPQTATVIRLDTDHEGHRYIAWEDERILSAVNRWINRNS